MGFSPLIDALRPTGAGRLPPAGSHAPRQRVTQRPGMPGDQADLLPAPSSPTRTAPSPVMAIKVIDQQNLYLLSHHCLLL